MQNLDRCLIYPNYTKVGEFLQNCCNGASYQMFSCKEMKAFEGNDKLETFLNNVLYKI